MNRKYLAVGAAAALTISLAACGSDSSKSSGSSSAASTKTIASTLILGGPPEFKTRADGIDGLKKNYGVEFKSYSALDTGGPVTINALKTGLVDAADIFSTDPSIPANKFVVLDDPKSNFAAQNVLPVINKAKATDGVKKTLNAISAKLDTSGLTKIVASVVTDKQDPVAVAKQWLSSNGLAATGTDAAGVSLTVGSANFPENVLLASIYAEALKAQGAAVTTKLNIGSREKYYPALQSGDLDLFAEYSGTILQYLDKNATATSPDDVYAALQKALPANLIVLNKSTAQDSDAIVVTQETATKYNLKSIADLAKIAK